jgi:hypothetical protein
MGSPKIAVVWSAGVISTGGDVMTEQEILELIRLLCANNQSDHRRNQNVEKRR